jgi:hypothetical protein
VSPRSPIGARIASHRHRAEDKGTRRAIYVRSGSPWDWGRIASPTSSPSP